MQMHAQNHKYSGAHITHRHTHSARQHVFVVPKPTTQQLMRLKLATAKTTKTCPLDTKAV